MIELIVLVILIAISVIIIVKNKNSPGLFYSIGLTFIIITFTYQIIMFENNSSNQKRYQNERAFKIVKALIGGSKTIFEK